MPLCLSSAFALFDACTGKNNTQNNIPGTISYHYDVRPILSDKCFNCYDPDAMMAVFRGNFQSDRAIDACLSVRSQIQALPLDETDAIGFRPQVSIGINYGELISGNIGSANLRRLDYTVVGDVVNTAARLQSVAKADQIVISEAAYEKVKESFNCRSIGQVSLKNKQNPVSVYEVLD